MADVATDTNGIPCQQRQQNTVVSFDNMWTTQGNAKFQIVSANQGGDGSTGGEHYLQVDENTGKVSANGMGNSKSTLFKVFTMMHMGGASGAPEILFMLEWIGGEDSGQDGRMVAIVNNRLTSIEKTHSYTKITDAEPEVLFRKKIRSPTSRQFLLQHAVSEHQYIGFDESGKALAPSDVNPRETESLFIVLPFSKFR